MGEEEKQQKTEASAKAVADKYRSILQEETGNKHWGHGGPPIFENVNKLFEEGGTRVQVVNGCDLVQLFSVSVFSMLVMSICCI